MILDKKELKQRGLVQGQHHLPYNPELITRAKELRKHMTNAEKKLWYLYLRNFKYRVIRQRPIDHYIVDFYCPMLKLVIEVDGETHCTEQDKEYDDERTAILEGYGLNVVRFWNTDIINNLNAVVQQIEEFAKLADSPTLPNKKDV
jgi:very-short-patch-repair endonuclease